MSTLQVTASRHFLRWLEQQEISLAVTTYQAGKIFLIGRKSNGRLGVHMRTFDRAMGLCVQDQTLWAATAFQIWRFENIMRDGPDEEGVDRLYVPRAGYTTGDIDVHDLAWSDERLHFVTTLFSAVATLSDRDSFKPVWTPPFISKLAAEDRCHLNGLTTVDGIPRYATAVADSDAASAWRDHRVDGGVVIDIVNNEVIARGFSMPHSPRWHRDKLWLLDSGTGHLGYLKDGQFERVAFLPGYARGLAFCGKYALVGLSRPRNDPTFVGLPLQDALEQRKAQPKCGVFVVNLDTGDIEQWVEMADPVHELYDVAVLPGAVRPKMLGFQTDTVRHTVTAEGNPGMWLARPDT